MKNIIIYIVFFLLSSFALVAQVATAPANLSQNQNYIRTKTMLNDNGSAYTDQIQYFDGLGRPIQTNQRGITPSGKDLVTLQEYDGFGREDKTWLPAVVNNSDGAFVDIASLRNTASQSHGGDSRPFSQTIYEASPLKRPIDLYGPGQEWFKSRTMPIGETPIKVETLTNSTTNPVLSCALFESERLGTQDSDHYLWNSSLVDAGTMTVTKKTYENGSESYKFIDRNNNIKLIRNVANGKFADTYYVYDDWGGIRDNDQLIHVLLPIASDYFRTSYGGNLNEFPKELMLNQVYSFNEQHDGTCLGIQYPGKDWKYVLATGEYEALRSKLFADGERSMIFNANGEETLTNSTTNPVLSCNYYWSESVNWQNRDHSLWHCGLVDAGTMTVTKKTYENGSESYKFVDGDNNIRLIRNVVNGEFADTYYVYDEYQANQYDKLLHVLLPEASAVFNRNSDLSDYPKELLNYIYTFKKDQYSSCFGIQYPGKEWKHDLATGEYEALRKKLFADGERYMIFNEDGEEDYSADKKRGQHIEYLTNNSSTNLICPLYGIDSYNKSILYRQGNYTKGELFVTKFTDEDNNVSYEFKDKLGRVVLNRQIDKGNQFDTYFVYDSWGNLVVVLPPLAIDEISNKNSIELKNLGNYAYLYQYDNRNRCTYKKLPGCEPIYYVYDRADQLIFSQDGEQRKNGEWAFSIPDAFGRPALTGVANNILLQGSATNTLAQNVKIDVVMKATLLDAANGEHKGYQITGAVLVYPTYYSVNYYDNYNYKKNAEISDKGLYYDSWKGAEYNKRYGTDVSIFEAKGLLTGAMVAQLEPNGTVKYLYSSMYYDNRGQLIQSKSTNHLGGIEEEYIAYNFTGQPTERLHVHSLANGNHLQEELYTYSYDHAGRLIDTKHKWRYGEEILLALNEYDEQGRLKIKTRSQYASITSCYDYNIRSWISSIEDNYSNLWWANTTSSRWHTYSYAGNITAINFLNENEYEGCFGQDSKYEDYFEWKYKYDGLSRLTEVNYRNVYSPSNTSNHDEHFTYDKQGNILTSRRHGLVDGRGNDLQYSYLGNQVTNIHDAGWKPNLLAPADFKDYSKNAAKTKIEYTYNANGAMTQDLNKGISRIQYNSLNLPQQMDIKSPVAEAKNEYTYTASGQKLRVFQKWNPTFNSNPLIGSTVNEASMTSKKTTDYVGNFIYENGVLKRILVDGGYIQDGTYHYYLTDHLGNNCVVADTDANIIQSSDYHAFGQPFDSNEGQEIQPYKYNGKELDNMHGLNMYDYAARSMDPAMGRFSSVDPLAEKYYSISPYAYVANNPLKYIDPDGRDIKVFYKDNNGINKTWLFNGGNQRDAPRNQFVQNFVTAYDYNIGNRGGDNLAAVATSTEYTMSLVQTEGSSKFSVNIPEKGRAQGVVRWNPTEGLETPKGILSPATILEHEMSHGINWETNTAEHYNNKKIADPHFTNKEERNVITGPEYKTAVANGEFKTIPKGELNKDSNYRKHGSNENKLIKVISAISNNKE